MLKVLRPAIARVLTPVGQVLAKTPVTPNALTIIGTIGMSAGALWLFPTGHLFAGVMVCTGFVLTDMLDGTLARIKGTTGKFGAFLDSTLDRVADAAVFAGLAAWFVLGGHDKLLAALSVFCLVAGVLREGAGREPRLALRCWFRRTDRTAAYRPSCYRTVRAWRTVCPRYRALAAGGGECVHVRSARDGGPSVSGRDRCRREPAGSRLCCCGYR
jgi:CDP-diacylglycerol---glycerol-3-phosphate 3-phosphatidyltransferase